MTAVLHRAGPWITPVLILTEVVLVWTGLVGLTEAVVAAVVVELAVALTAITRARVALRSFRQARAGGRDGWAAAEDGLAAMLPRPAARVVLIEVRIWVCLARWIARRRPHGECFGYGGGLRSLLWAVLGLVVLEGAVVEVVLVAILGHANAWVWVAFGLHIYVLVWIGGLLGSLRTEPHRLVDDRLELRDSVFGSVSAPMSSINDVRARRRPNTGRSGFVVTDSTGLLAYADATVRVELDSDGEPVTVRGVARPGLTTLAITVDDPYVFTCHVRSRSIRGDRGPEEGPWCDERAAPA